MVRIVFMGTPAFAVPILKALMETQEVVGVVTQPDRPAGRGRTLRPSPVKETAEAARLPLYQPASLRKPDAAEPLRHWQPDAIIVAAYGQILRPHILQLPPLGCINVHASLLPRWRGASPIQHALLAGDKETGISLMQMDEGLDTGPVFVQRAIPIQERETAATLHDRLAALGAEMIHSDLDDILSTDRRPVPQDDEQATYAPLIQKEDGRLDWTQDSLILDRRIRAMTPWPGAFTAWQGQRLKINAAHPLQAASGAARAPVEPGRAFSLEGTVAVATGDGFLALENVQLEGRSATDIDAFVRGRPDFIGTRLGD